MIEVVYDVGFYRRRLSEIVGDGDTVVEIGPHVGKSTDAYIGRCSKAVLVDKGVDCMQALESYCCQNTNVEFVCGDARQFSTTHLVLKHVSECDVLAVDIGGGRFPDTVFKVWATWSGVLKPRDSIIRCRGLVEFLRRASSSDSCLPKEYADDGWLSMYGRATPDELRVQLDEFENWVKI